MAFFSTSPAGAWNPRRRTLQEAVAADVTSQRMPVTLMAPAAFPRDVRTATAGATARFPSCSRLAGHIRNLPRKLAYTRVCAYNPNTPASQPAASAAATRTAPVSIVMTP